MVELYKNIKSPITNKSNKNTLKPLLDSNTDKVNSKGIYKKLNFHKKKCSCRFCATLVDI